MLFLFLSRVDVDLLIEVEGEGDGPFQFRRAVIENLGSTKNNVGLNSIKEDAGL